MPYRLLNRSVHDGFHQLVKLSGGQPALGGSNLSIQPVVVCACIVHHGVHRNGRVAMLHDPEHFVIRGSARPRGGDEVISLRHGLAPEPVYPMPVVPGQLISVRECCTVDLKLNTLIIVKIVQHSLVNCRCGQEPEGSDIPVNGHEIAKAGGSVWIGTVGGGVVLERLHKQCKERIRIAHIQRLLAGIRNGCRVVAVHIEAICCELLLICGGDPDFHDIGEAAYPAGLLHTRAVHGGEHIAAEIQHHVGLGIDSDCFAYLRHPCWRLRGGRHGGHWHKKLRHAQKRRQQRRPFGLFHCYLPVFMFSV